MEITIPKYIPIILMVIGFIAFASAADGDFSPCDNKPYAGGQDCMDHKGKYIFDYGTCLENDDVPDEGVKGVLCIKPDHAFNTRAECEEKCKAEYEDLPSPED